MPFFTHNLVVLAALLAAVLLVGAAAVVHSAAGRANRILGDVDTEDGPLQTFKGGLRWPLPAGLGSTNTPPVLVGLELFDWGLRIGARWSWLGPFVPSWCARYEELWAVEHVRRSLRMSKRGSQGVRIRAPLPGTPLIFWTSASAALLDALESRGVAVVRVVTTPRFWSNE